MSILNNRRITELETNMELVKKGISHLKEQIASIYDVLKEAEEKLIDLEENKADKNLSLSFDGKEKGKGSNKKTDEKKG